MLDDKNTQIFIGFIINHKNTINIIYLLGFCGGEQTFLENIRPPLSCSLRGVFREDCA
jgi:hypothetical protein